MRRTLTIWIYYSIWKNIDVISHTHKLVLLTLFYIFCCTHPLYSNFNFWWWCCLQPINSIEIGMSDTLLRTPFVPAIAVIHKYIYIITKTHQNARLSVCVVCGRCVQWQHKYIYYNQFHRKSMSYLFIERPFHSFRTICLLVSWKL